MCVQILFLYFCNFIFCCVSEESNFFFLFAQSNFLDFFQILGVDIFSKILWLKEGFIEYLGNILSLAQATIFTVPKLEQFILAQMIFNGTEDQNHDFSFKVSPRKLLA